jgi:hypothetical protein
MAERDHDNDPALARQKLLESFGDIDAWRFTDTAYSEGRVALRPACGKTPSDFEMVDYIAQRLRAGFPLIRTPMGEPPGSRGIGWVMNNPDGNDTYIKLKIEQDGVFDIAWVLSCHTSKHEKPS